MRKLRTRSLSVSEARLVLKGHGLAADAIEDVIDDFMRRGYLDDAVLAELLVTAGVERKGQGRVALSRALAQRGILVRSSMPLSTSSRTMTRSGRWSSHGPKRAR